MSTSRDSTFWSAPLGFLLVLVASILLTTFLVWMVWAQRHEPSHRGDEAYLLSGLPTVGEGALFQLEGQRSSIAMRSGRLTPKTAAGQDATSLTPGDTRLLVGDYHYEFRVSHEEEPGRGVRWRVRFELVGARTRVGDEIGRAPDFLSTGRMTYDPERTAAEEAGASRRRLRLWLDGMPVSVFRVVDPVQCGIVAGQRDACFEATGAIGRLTHERVDAAGATQFLHPAPGAFLRLSAADRLWVGHLSFSVVPVAGAAPSWDLALTSDHRTRRGDRRQLGSIGFGGAATIEAGAGPVGVFEIANRFREGHLAGARWDPETEDDYQLLIDAELLCLAEVTAAGVTTPQLVWADLAQPGCVDRIGRRVTAAAPKSIPDATVEIYRRRRRNDLLVDRANERLRAGRSTPPEDLPFVFEWWPTADPAGGVRQVPVSVWGVRTMGTLRPFEAAPGAVRPPERGVRPIVLESRTGAVVEIARSRAARREYNRSELRGLGPLLGVRGATDGLDTLTPDTAAPGAAESPVRLTIDPDLQRDLWTALKHAANTRQLNPQIPQSPAHGLSAVAIDTFSGSVLAVLNWPDGLIWEDPARFATIATSQAGTLRPPLNHAMLRADKVGSVLKLLTMYTMADAGVLDTRPTLAAPPCPGGNEHFFGVMVTDGSGGVAANRLGPRFRDKWPGAIPSGVTGMNHGLDRSTGSSCNTYFGLAATQLLGGEPSETVWMETCPVTPQLQRTDNWRAPRWVLCAASAATQKRLGGEPNTHWLLLPGGEQLLRARADAGLIAEAASGRRGFFGHAIDAGFRLLYREAGQGTATLERRAGTARYRDSPYVRDWFSELSSAEARVFQYPALSGPVSLFGGGTDRVDQRTVEIAADPAGWFAFASQVVGEGARGSALSVAVLYSAIARTDGRMVTPHLIPQAGVSTGARAFGYTATRLDRLRGALRAPLVTGGTARGTVGEAIRRLGFGDSVFGKTGTFEYEAPRPLHAVSDVNVGCGVSGASITPSSSKPSPQIGWGDWLGAALCETDELSVTRVHRYPRAVTMPPTARPDRSDDKSHTSFAAVITPRPGSGASPVAFAIVADTVQVKAAALAAELIPLVWNWMHVPPTRGPRP